MSRTFHHIRTLDADARSLRHETRDRLRAGDLLIDDDDEYIDSVIPITDDMDLNDAIDEFFYRMVEP